MINYQYEMNKRLNHCLWDWQLACGTLPYLYCNDTHYSKHSTAKHNLKHKYELMSQPHWCIKCILAYSFIFWTGRQTSNSGLLICMCICCFQWHIIILAIIRPFMSVCCGVYVYILVYAHVVLNDHVQWMWRSSLSWKEWTTIGSWCLRCDTFAVLVSWVAALITYSCFGLDQKLSL